MVTRIVVFEDNFWGFNISLLGLVSTVMISPFYKPWMATLEGEQRYLGDNN